MVIVFFGIPYLLIALYKASRYSVKQCLQLNEKKEVDVFYVPVVR